MSDEHPKYIRIAIEMEIEVTDPIQAKVYDISPNDVGVGSNPDVMLLATIVHGMIAHTLDERGPEAGFKFLSASAIPRFPKNETTYRELTFPEMPRRADNGELLGGL